MAQNGPPAPWSPAFMVAIQGGNMELAGTSLIVLVALAVALLIYRIIISSIRGTRRLASMESDGQIFWKQPTRWYSFIKQHIIYAPLFRKQHNSERQIVKGLTIRGIPTRFQSIFTMFLVLTNIVYCVVGIEWNMLGKPQMVAHLQFRTGTIAVANLIPIVLFSGRNNPFVLLLNISYESFTILHKTLGRLVVLEAIAHVVCYLVNKVSMSGWIEVAKAFKVYGSASQTGLLAVCAALAIAITAASPIRRAFYDLWHHIHVILIIFLTVALWYHVSGIPQQNFIRAFIFGWIVEHVIRLIRLVYRNVGAGGTQALIEYLPGEAIKVTLSIARPWNFKPGQHVFVAIPSIGLWTTHPFSLAWSDSPTDSLTSLTSTLDIEKGHPKISLPKNQTTTITTKPIPDSPTSASSTTSTLTASSADKITMSAIIRRRGGFTQRLWAAMKKTPSGRFTARAFVEGPYGIHNSLSSYGTVVLFAGGVGITHQISYVRSLLSGYADSKVCCRRLLLVWAVQSSEHLEWIRPWMTEILAMQGRRDILRIQLYITRPTSSTDIQSTSPTVQILPGRPHIDAIVERECREQVGAMAVSVCGPGSMSDDVRHAARSRQSKASIDYIEQAFGW